MLTVFVTTIVVLVTALFALMAIVPFMLESRPGANRADNVVTFDRTRRHGHDIDRPAA